MVEFNVSKMQIKKATKWLYIYLNGGSGRNWTSDTWIFSRFMQQKPL